MKKFIFIIASIVLSINGYIPYSRGYSFFTGSKLGIMPQVGDLTFNEIFEIATIKEDGELIVVMTSNLGKYRDFMATNWVKEGEIYVNKHENNLFAIKIPFKNETTLAPVIFDVNKDGVEDIILFFGKRGRILAFNFNALYQDYIDGNEILINRYIIWDNNLDNDEITGNASLFQRPGSNHLVFGTKKEYLYFLDIDNGKFSRNIDLNRYTIVGDRRAIECSPLIYDVNGDRINDIVVGSNSGTFIALNGRDYSKIWTYTKRNSPIIYSPTVANVDNKRLLFLPFKEYRVVAVNASDGKEIWTFDTGSHVTGSVVAGMTDMDGNNEILLTTYDGTIYCLNASNGQKIWTFTSGGNIQSPLLVHDFDRDNTYDILITNDSGVLEVLNGKTRTLIPELRFITKGLQSITSQPLLGDFNNNEVLDIIVNSTDGYLYYFPANYDRIIISAGTMINTKEKGDFLRTGNIVDNIRNNTGMKLFLDNIRKAHFYELAEKYFRSDDITNAAVFLKKVLNIDENYKDAYDKFGKIIDSYLEYQFNAFTEAIDENDIRKAQSIYIEVQKTSSEYEKLKIMNDTIEKKNQDFRKAEELFKKGKQDLDAGDILTGYEKLENAKQLKPIDGNIDKLMAMYRQEIELYREMVDYIKKGDHKKANVNFKKLYEKNPRFPGLLTYKNTILLNLYKFHMIGALALIIVLVIVLVIQIKKKKKLIEEAIRSKTVEDRVEVAQTAGSFEISEEDESEKSVSEIAEAGIYLEKGYGDIGDDVKKPVATEMSSEDESIEKLEKEEDREDNGIELGGIDLGVEHVNEDELKEEPQEKWGMASGTTEDVTVKEEEGEEPSMMQENIEVRLNLAVQLYQSENYEDAKNELEKILKVDSKFKHKAKSYLAFCYYALGETDLSMNTIKKIPYQKDEIPVTERKEILNILGEGFLKNGLHRPAIGVYKKMIDISDGLEKKNIFYKLGNIYLETGNKEDAIKYFKELFLLDPNFRDVGEKLDELGFS